MTLEHTRDNVYAISSVCSGNQPPLPSSSQSYNSTAGLGNAGFPPGFWTSDDDYALYGRLRERIEGTAFNAAVFLGEGREALATMVEAARRINKSVRQLRKGQVVQAAESLVGKKRARKHSNISSSKVNADWVSSNWLQLQYGWLPLVKDVFGAAKHLAWYLERDQPMVYRASLRKSGPGVSPSSSYTVSGSVYQRKSIKAIVTRINQVSLLGLTDPASLAWEKLPWSFVADWFIPVGNYLEAVNLDRSLTAKYVISHKTYQSCTGATYIGGGSQRWSAGYLRVNIRFERTVESSLPVRLPQFKPLSEVPSWTRAANAISLLFQAFK
jgi:hypothetical protein